MPSDPSGWVETTLEALTLSEKLALSAGADLWHTVAVERLGVPALKLADGPNGVRGADGNHGPTSTSFPVGAAMGATWDPDLIEDVGRALGEQAEAKGVSVLLGPTVNIPRVPTAGRNFECFSEDPLLSGLLAAAYIRGVQSRGVAACIKHFVCNDQETDRYVVDVDVDEAALREVYLEPFRIAVSEAGPWTAMTAYNTVNGVTCSEHPLVDDVLRGEFGFDGLVVSDWYGTYSTGAAGSGLDLEMPGPGRWLAPDAVASEVTAGRVATEHVDRRVRRLLTLIERTGARRRSLHEAADERSEHRELARRVATSSMVLLTNEGLLPLEPPGRIAVIGDLAATTPHQGGGSSSVNAHRVVSVLDGIRAAVDGGCEVIYEAGVRVSAAPPPLDPSLLRSPMEVAYFEGVELAGPPVRVVESDRPFLAFFGSRDPWVELDDFSVRMSAVVVANEPGLHRFRFSAMGRLRVMARGVTVVDAWSGTDPAGHDWDVELASGEELDLRVEFAPVPDGETWRFVAIGCRPPGPDPSIEAAAAAAAAADAAVVVVGLTPEFEAEGFDRPDLRLPSRQDELVASVAAVQPRTVVVMTAGAPIEMPWVDDVGAVLHAWYGGQEIGHAVADVVFGDADPGGRLPVTFPRDSDQHPAGRPGTGGSVRYAEGIHVGGRAFDVEEIEPAFPLGHGLSYAEVVLEVVDAERTPSGVTVRVSVTNRAGRRGSEVVLVHGLDVGGLARRVVGFAKVDLEGGASANVVIEVPNERTRSWDDGRWHDHTGPLRLEVAVGPDVRVVDVLD